MIRHEPVSAGPDGSGSPARSAEGVQADLPRLAELLRGRRTVVLTGAGCSTESGIPDYRGPDGKLRARMPMRYQEFMRRRRSRARYWARSAVGWVRFSSARPNAAHRALARLEEGGWVTGVITQNVDGLHQAGGSRAVLELHGSLSRVRCMECGSQEGRNAVQRRLEALNPTMARSSGVKRAGPLGPSHGRDSPRSAPDGDVELPEGVEAGFRIPSCLECGGVLKPDVVFFGENVPGERVRRAWELYREAELLLVVGSSLTVFSGRRFVLQASKEGRPVAIVNQGPTRGDETARLKVPARAEKLLPALVGRLEELEQSGERRGVPTGPPDP